MYGETVGENSPINHVNNLYETLQAKSVELTDNWENFEREQKLYGDDQLKKKKTRA